MVNVSVIIPGQVVPAYPDYTGSLSVSFSKVLFDTGAGGTFFEYFDLVADPACFSVGPSATANSCGIHLHTLIDPTQDACASGNIGGHYYSGSSDPWMHIVYGNKTTGYNMVNEAPNASGKAFVIHDQNGARIACTTFDSYSLVALSHSISYCSAAACDIPIYPGYAGSLTPGVENFRLSQIDVNGTLYLSWTAINADLSCIGETQSALNSCGFHLHSGFGCPSQAAGGHLSPSGGMDPWMIARYAYGTHSAGALLVENTGYTIDTPAVIVIHDIAGARIACASICGSTSVPNSDKADPGAINGFAGSSVIVTCNPGYSSSVTDPTARIATAVCDESGTGQFSSITCSLITTNGSFLTSTTSTPLEVKVLSAEQYASLAIIHQVTGVFTILGSLFILFSFFFFSLPTFGVRLLSKSSLL